MLYENSPCTIKLCLAELKNYGCYWSDFFLIVEDEPYKGPIPRWRLDMTNDMRWGPKLLIVLTESILKKSAFKIMFKFLRKQESLYCLGLFPTAENVWQGKQNTFIQTVCALGTNYRYSLKFQLLCYMLCYFSFSPWVRWEDLQHI